jgi:hypothetical protein
MRNISKIQHLVDISRGRVGVEVDMNSPNAYLLLSDIRRGMKMQVGKARICFFNRSNRLYLL